MYIALTSLLITHTPTWLPQCHQKRIVLCILVLYFMRWDHASESQAQVKSWLDVYGRELGIGAVSEPWLRSVPRAALAEWADGPARQIDGRGRGREWKRGDEGGALACLLNTATNILLMSPPPLWCFCNAHTIHNNYFQFDNTITVTVHTQTPTTLTHSDISLHNVTCAVWKYLHLFLHMFFR